MNLTGWSKLVGRVHEAIGKTVSVLRRGEGPGGVVFVAQEYQLSTIVEGCFRCCALDRRFTFIVTLTLIGRLFKGRGI